MKDEQEGRGEETVAELSSNSSFILHLSSFRRTILVFAKYPEPGRVKTRLAATVGPECAAAMYRSWIAEVFAILQPMRGQARVICCFDGAPRSSFAEWDRLADEWWPQP